MNLRSLEEQFNGHIPDVCRVKVRSGKLVRVNQRRITGPINREHQHFGFHNSVNNMKGYKQPFPEYPHHNDSNYRIYVDQIGSSPLLESPKNGKPFRARQNECCIMYCSNFCGTHRRNRLRGNYVLKPEYESLGYDRICDTCFQYLDQYSSGSNETNNHFNLRDPSVYLRNSSMQNNGRRSNTPPQAQQSGNLHVRQEKCCLNECRNNCGKHALHELKRSYVLKPFYKFNGFDLVCDFCFKMDDYNWMTNEVCWVKKCFNRPTRRKFSDVNSRLKVRYESEYINICDKCYSRYKNEE